MALLTAMIKSLMAAMLVPMALGSLVRRR